MNISALAQGVLAVVAVAACAVSMPINGRMDDGEALQGAATNFTGDPMAGTFEVSLEGGTRCQGVYRFTSSSGGLYAGTAPLACTDGKSGVVDFTSNGWSGRGSGRIGDRVFTVKF